MRCTSQFYGPNLYPGDQSQYYEGQIGLKSRRDFGALETPVAPAVVPGTAPRWVAQPLAPPRYVDPFWPPLTVPAFVPVPKPTPHPETPTWPEGSSFAQPRPVAPPRTRTVAPPQRPPGPKTKETKSRTRQVVARIASIAFEVTEFNDLVESLWKALPASLRKKLGKPDTPQEMYSDVYLHWRDINVEDAIKNVLKNMIEDAMVGAKSKAFDDFRKLIGGSATKTLENALEPWVPGMTGGTQTATKALDGATEAAWAALTGPNAGLTLGELHTRVTKALSLQ